MLYKIWINNVSIFARLQNVEERFNETRNTIYVMTNFKWSITRSDQFLLG